MALSFNYTLDGNIYVQGIEKLVLIKNNFDISLENAYIKIINQNGDKVKISLNVGIYDAKDGNLISTDYYEFTPDVSDTSLNFIKQGYEYMKTLEKYENAIDC